MKKKVEIYNKIRNCSKVGFHSWVGSSVGVIRKPNNKINTWKGYDEVFETKPEKKSWLKRFWDWFKNLFRRQRS